MPTFGRGLLLLCYVTVAGGQWLWDSEYRPSGWVPRPERDWWVGQKSECTATYGSYLGAYSRRTYGVRGCVRDVVAAAELHDVTPRKTVDSHYEVEVRPTEAGCLRTCYTANTVIPGWNDTAEGERPLSAPSFLVPSKVPYKLLEVVWDPVAELCYCFNTKQLEEHLCPEDDARCDKHCNTSWLQIPLGCLFTGEQDCKDAPSDSCIWSKGCCSDSLGYEWTYRIAPPLWWVFSGFSVLLISIIIMMYRQVPRVRPQPADPNMLGAELIEKHKHKYEAFLEKLVIELAPDETISQCSVCLSDLTEDRCAQFECGHRLHYTCMKDYIMYQIGKAQRRYPECPVCRRRVMLDDDSEGEPDQDGADSPRGTGVSVVVESVGEVEEEVTSPALTVPVQEGDEELQLIRVEEEEEEVVGEEGREPFPTGEEGEEGEEEQGEGDDVRLVE